MKGRIGVERNGVKVLVTHVPNRRKPALVLEIDGDDYPVALFTDEGRADWFLGVMEEFFDNRLH